MKWKFLAGKEIYRVYDTAKFSDNGSSYRLCGISNEHGYVFDKTWWVDQQQMGWLMVYLETIPKKMFGVNESF